MEEEIREWEVDVTERTVRRFFWGIGIASILFFVGRWWVGRWHADYWVDGITAALCLSSTYQLGWWLRGMYETAHDAEPGTCKPCDGTGWMRCWACHGSGGEEPQQEESST